jgi:tetratricopeptide (TPR) repeat protein
MRIAIARAQILELHFESPEDLEGLPQQGRRLVADLREIDARLRLLSERETPSLQAMLNRAVVLAVLEDPAARAESDRAVLAAPQSIKPLLVRARLRRHWRERRGALDDVQRALALEPDDPRCLALRGALKSELGDPQSGLADLDRAERLGAPPSIHQSRARALLDLGQPKAAAEACSRSIAVDADDVRAYILRARAFRGLGEWDRAIADVEQAIARSTQRPEMLPALTVEYTRCLIHRPDRLPRVLALVRAASVSGPPRGAIARRAE